MHHCFIVIGDLSWLLTKMVFNWKDTQALLIEDHRLEWGTMNLVKKDFTSPLKNARTFDPKPNVWKLRHSDAAQWEFSFEQDKRVFTRHDVSRMNSRSKSTRSKISAAQKAVSTSRYSNTAYWESRINKVINIASTFHKANKETQSTVMQERQNLVLLKSPQQSNTP